MSKSNVYTVNVQFELETALRPRGHRLLSELQPLDGRSFAGLLHVLRCATLA